MSNRILMLSPADMLLLIHCHAIAEPIPNRDAKHVIDCLGDFEENDLIERTAGSSGSGYRTTEKGKKWIDMMLSTPFPEKVWIDPRTLKEEK